MDNKELTRLVRISERPGRRGWRCPDEAQLAAWVDHRLDGRTADRVEAHLAWCEPCLEQVAFLASLEPSGETSVAPRLCARAVDLAPQRRSPWHGPVVRWASATAVATCAVVAIVLYVHEPGAARPGGQPGAGSETTRVPAPIVSPASVPAAAPPVVSAPTTTPAGPASKTAGPSRPTVRKSTVASSTPVLVSPTEGGALPSFAPEFRWEAVAGSLFYEVHVVTEDGSVVWQSNVTSTRARLPDGYSLRTGARYFVWVRAHLSGGGTVKSAAVSFHVGG